MHFHVLNVSRIGGPPKRGGFPWGVPFNLTNKRQPKIYTHTHTHCVTAMCVCGRVGVQSTPLGLLDTFVVGHPVISGKEVTTPASKSNSATTMLSSQKESWLHVYNLTKWYEHRRRNLAQESKSDCKPFGMCAKGNPKTEELTTSVS